LDEEGKEEGRNLSQEAERRLEATLDEQDALDRAMILAYGADNGPLLHLIGEVLRVAAPHGGEWIENDAALQDVAAGLVQLLRRLRAPDDGAMADSGVEKRVDDLLSEQLGYTGVKDSPRARWAAEKRKRFGIYAERLTRYRRAVRERIPSDESREMAKPEPEDAAGWGRAIAPINERVEPERAKRAAAAKLILEAAAKARKNREDA